MRKLDKDDFIEWKEDYTYLGQWKSGKYSLMYYDPYMYVGNLYYYEEYSGIAVEVNCSDLLDLWELD